MTQQTFPRLSEAIIEFYEKLFSWENEVARNSGLSPQQNHTIEIVGSDSPIRMKPLAQKLSVTMGTLSVMINRLEKEGYVIREKDPKDKRGFNILLTEKGRIVYEEHHAYHQKLVEDIICLLEPGEVKQFLIILKKINEAF